MQIDKIEARGAIKIENLIEAVKAYTEAGELGLDRNELARKLGLSLKSADRAREALSRQGAVFSKLKANSRGRTPLAMEQGPKWHVPVDSAVRLSFATAISLLSRSGATVIAEQLTPIEKMAQDSMPDRRQSEFDR